MSYISKGSAKLIDSAQWLLFDNQSPECSYFYDTQGMVKCVNGETLCYSTALTKYAGNCDLVNVTFVNITSKLRLYRYENDGRGGRKDGSTVVITQLMVDRRWCIVM